MKPLVSGGRGVRTKNYYGSKALGNVQFSSGSITQKNSSVDIDTVLTTGTKAGGGGASSYGTGDNAPPGSDVYEFTVANKDGSYDGDMFVANFKDLTIDASQWVTVDQPNRGLLIYVDGDCVINGTLAMSCRGGFSDPAAGKGGGNSPSDDSAVSATGIRLPVLKDGETDTLAAADFAGCGNAAVNAVANQRGIASNGKIFTIAKTGATGGSAVSGDSNGNAGSNGSTNQSGGGASGASWDMSGGATSGAGGDGMCFSGGAGGGNAIADGGAATGGAGSSIGGAGGTGSAVGGGVARDGAGNAGNDNGTGGLVILIVRGNLSGSGDILAKGTSGNGVTSDAGSGGAGGGNILILHAGTNTFAGSTNSDGGAGGDGASRDGGTGGAGVVQGPTQINV